MTVTQSDASEAARVTGETRRVALYHASRHRSSVVRFAAALNLHTDRGNIEHLLTDPAPHVAELSAARIEGLDHLEHVLTRWALAREYGRDPEAKMDAEGITVVRHVARRNVEDLTVRECFDLIRESVKAGA